MYFTSNHEGVKSTFAAHRATYLYVYIYIYIYINKYINVCVNIYLYIIVCIRVYECSCAYVSIPIHLCSVLLPALPLPSF